MTPKKSSNGSIVMLFCSGVRVGAATRWAGSEAGSVKGACMQVMVCASISISAEDLEVLRQFPKTLKNREVDILGLGSKRNIQVQVAGSPSLGWRKARRDWFVWVS